MTEADLLALMKRFRVAYAKGDREGLLATTSSGFEWHQHRAHGYQQLPTGRVLRGVDAMLEEIAWRQQNWTDVAYENMQERSAGDLLVQTFTITGKEAGQPFHAKVVDLYPVAGGLITRKDTYWKYQD
jgi:ketosteroid isomerase-like protein